jgi:hypothetical protein
MGRQIRQGFINPNVGHEISTEGFFNGLYFVTLIQENKVIEKRKLIIMK